MEVCLNINFNGIGKTLCLELLGHVDIILSPVCITLRLLRSLGASDLHALDRSQSAEAVNQDETEE